MNSSATASSGRAVEYLQVAPDALPDDRVLVHNFAPDTPDQQPGVRGFRFFLTPLADHHKVCECEFAPNVPIHHTARGR